jgi:hypothetical protein
VDVKEELLLFGFGSVVEALTVAVFVEYTLELNVCALTLMVTMSVPPTLRLPRLQLTVVVEAVYEQLPAVEDAEE